LFFGLLNEDRLLYRPVIWVNTAQTHFKEPLAQERRFLEHSQRLVPKKNRIPDAGSRSIPICHRVAFLPGYSTASAVRQTHTFMAFHLLGNSIGRISFHFGGLYI